MRLKNKTSQLGKPCLSQVSGLRSQVRGLYAIADSHWSPCDFLPDLARKFLEGGCRIVQLRMKKVGGDIREAAHGIMNLKSRYDFTFIVNDHVDVALDVGADGVHVGENDEPIESIRKHAGHKLLIGYSSHSIDEAMRAARDGADYVAFGAIFPTQTKGPAHPVQGTHRLQELVKSIDIPVVAIGGINRDNVRQVIDAGVSAVAMISALVSAPDVVAETRWFVNKCLSV